SIRVLDCGDRRLRRRGKLHGLRLRAEGEGGRLMTWLDRTVWRLAGPTSFALLVAAAPALAQGTLRIAMTATDVPTTTGVPNNGFEGVRFMGFTAFDALVNWDLTKADVPADIVPGLAESW